MNECLSLIWMVYDCLLFLCMFMPMYIAYIKGGPYRNKEEVRTRKDPEIAMRNSVLRHPNSSASKERCGNGKSLHRCTQSTLRHSFTRRLYIFCPGTQSPEVS